jgi:hypothetical protein
MCLTDSPNRGDTRNLLLHNSSFLRIVKTGLSMVRMLTLCICSLLLALPAHPQEPTYRSLSSAEIKNDLFSSMSHKTEISTLHLHMQELGAQKKSVGLAVLYSLLVPGLGEYYAGNYRIGKFLSTAEAGLWLTYATFDIYGTSLRDDARSFAVRHAGVNPAGKSDQFFVDVGNFLNTDEFNEKRLRERSPERLYDAAAGEGWRWDSEEQRLHFRAQRISADNVLNNRKFVVTAIILNHLISAINAGRTAIAHNREINDQIGTLQLKADLLGGFAAPHGVMLTVSKSF